MRGIVPVLPLRRIEEAIEYDPFQEPEGIQVIPLRRVEEVIDPVVNADPIEAADAMAQQQLLDALTLMAAQNARWG